MALIDRISLPDTHSDMLLEFIRTIIPRSNCLATSLYNLRNSIHNKLNLNYEVFFLCKMCSEKLNKKKICESETCLSHSLVKDKFIYVVVNNVSNQIKEIIINHYDSILKYKG